MRGAGRQNMNMIAMNMTGPAHPASRTTTSSTTQIDARSFSLNGSAGSGWAGVVP